MKAIIVTISARGRVRASDGDGNTVTTKREGDLQFEEVYDSAALRLCKLMNWHGRLVKNHLLKAGVTIGRVYSWDGGSGREFELHIRN